MGGIFLFSSQQIQCFVHTDSYSTDSVIRGPLIIAFGEAIGAVEYRIILLHLSRSNVTLFAVGVVELLQGITAPSFSS